MSLDSIYNLKYESQKVAELEKDLVERRQKAQQLALDVETTINAAADTFLLDENEQPIDGVLYFYNGQCIVRVAGATMLLPIITISGDKIKARLSGNGSQPTEEV